jgi:hypothetical protein
LVKTRRVREGKKWIGINSLILLDFGSQEQRNNSGKQRDNSKITAISPQQTAIFLQQTAARISGSGTTCGIGKAPGGSGVGRRTTVYRSCFVL